MHVFCLKLRSIRWIYQRIYAESNLRTRSCYHRLWSRAHMTCADVHISGMGGIEIWRDALEFMLLGAGSLQVTTAVMQYGYRIIDDLIEGLEAYMKSKGVSSIKDMIGGASGSIVNHQSIERDTILFPVFDYDRCNGCGRCYISCMDGGHQAIQFDLSDRRPILLGTKCVGCHLCRLVCSEKAISTAKKSIKRNPNTECTN